NSIIKEILNKERQNIYKTKRRKINRRLLISIIAAAVLILTFAAAAAAYKSGRFAMHTETTQIGTNIYIEELEDGGASYDLGYSFNTNVKYIPDGFEEESYYQDDIRFYAKYKYEGSDLNKIGYPYFEITKKAASEGKFTVDGDETGLSRAYINGCEALCNFSEQYKSI
ncbi:MAG: hypothetical protein LIO44_02175, partial [Eubacterium sp.]|nr:hypothetical protein [Eubacterium sp.]